MPGVDWIPGVSQLKSAVQLITGDVEGAARTQENFAKECPVVSQVTSAVQVIAGDTDGALETQKRCLGTINNVANGIPVVGHVKGVVHHIVGDPEGGNQALNAATRTTVVLGSGAVGGLATGGVGAIAAGIAAGSAYDSVDTLVSERPKGIIAAVDTAVNNPNGGTIFDATAAVAGDGLTGYAGGQIGAKVANQVKVNSLEAARAAKNEQLNAAMFGEEVGKGGGGGGGSALSSGDVIKLGNEINSLTNQINNLRGPQYFYDPKTNSVVVENAGAGGGNASFVPNQGTSRNSEQQNSPQNVPALVTALDVDLYCGIIAQSGLNQAQREAKVLQYKAQSTGQTKLDQSLRLPSKISKRGNFNNQRSNDPQRNLTQEELEQLIMPNWLHVQMPTQFNFTGAGLLNNAWQGFMHTFARHYDQWIDYLGADFQDILDEIPAEVWTLINNVRNAQNRQQTITATNALTAYLRDSNNPNYMAIRSALLRAQLMIYDFVQRNLTYANYIGDGIGANGLPHVYFRIGNQVMVICLSGELYDPVREFGDGRNVRTITTIFFIDENDLNNNNVRAGRHF